MLGGLYAAYSASRALADGSHADALRAGGRLLHAERWLHFDPELWLNHWLQGVAALAVISCYFYATLHFLVTPALLVWLHRCHPARYVAARWTLVVTTLLGLCGFFLFPTAPPRLLPGAGFVDTMATFHGWGWWAGNASAAPKGLGVLANSYAALPSLHAAWSLWCGWVVARDARTVPVRIVGLLYPAGTAFVVMATANHYLLDLVAGWAVLGLAAASVWVAGRIRGLGATRIDQPFWAAGGGSDRGVRAMKTATAPTRSTRCSANVSPSARSRPSG
jgi:hypothetical protein